MSVFDWPIAYLCTPWALAPGPWAMGHAAQVSAKPRTFNISKTTTTTITPHAAINIQAAPPFHATTATTGPSQHPPQPQLPPPERGSAASIARAPLPAPLLPPTWPPRHHRPPQPTTVMRAPAPSPMEALPPRAPIPHRSPGLHGQSQRPRRRYRTAIRTASTRSWSSAS